MKIFDINSYKHIQSNALHSSRQGGGCVKTYADKIFCKLVSALVLGSLFVLGLSSSVMAAAPNNYTQEYKIIINPDLNIPPDGNVQRYSITIQSVPTISISTSTEDINAEYGEQAQGYTTVTVVSTSHLGYELDMKTQSHTDLICQDDVTKIVPTILSDTADDVIPMNTWGYNVSREINTVPTTWMPIPFSTFSDIIASPTEASDVLGDNYYVYFGVKIGAPNPSCTYTGDSIIYTVTNK